MSSPRFLILGSGGFVGQHLLSHAGDRDVVAPRSAEVDLLDLSQTLDFAQSSQPSVILHAAGFVGGIGLNKAHPGRMIMDNLRMGLNAIEAARTVPGCHVIIVSTVCAYPVDAPIPTPETTIDDGKPAFDTLPYGLAKRTLYHAAEALHREEGLNFTYLVPTNMYGPGDHFDEAKSHVVPALIRRAHETKERGETRFDVWGDGTQTRDLLYVEDAARAMWMVADRPATNDLYNISSNHEVSIRDLAEAVCDAVDFPGELTFDASKPGGAPRRGLDGAKISSTFGFDPAVDLKTGIRRTYEWFCANELP